MYSRQEAARLKQEFWAAFGLYMFPVLSAEGEKINWINYKTGEKDIYFRMNADNKMAMISIELTHKDPGIRELYFSQFIEFKNLLKSILGEEWIWKLHTTEISNRPVSRIFCSVSDVNIYKKDDWPVLISFFKPRIIKLDEFWSQVKYGFESLR